MKKILVTDSISEDSLDFLKQCGFEVLDHSNSEESTWEAILDEVDAWIIRSGTKVNASHIEKAKRLKVIVHTSSGPSNNF